MESMLWLFFFKANVQMSECKGQWFLMAYILWWFYSLDTLIKAVKYVQILSLHICLKVKKLRIEFLQFSSVMRLCFVDPCRIVNNFICVKCLFIYVSAESSIIHL